MTNWKGKNDLNNLFDFLLIFQCKKVLIGYKTLLQASC